MHPERVAGSGTDREARARRARPGRGRRSASCSPRACPTTASSPRSTRRWDGVDEPGADRGGRRRRRAAAHRDDDEPVRRARLDARARAAAPRRAAPARGRRRRAARTVRARVDPARSALDHDAHRARAVRDRTTAPRRYRLEPGIVLATMVPLTNTTAAPGLDGVRSRPVGRPHACATKAQLPARELRHHVRPRAAPVPGAAVLALGDRPRRCAGSSTRTSSTPEFDAVRPLPLQIGGDRARRGSVPGRLPAPLTTAAASTRSDASLAPAHADQVPPRRQQAAVAARRQARRGRHRFQSRR